MAPADCSGCGTATRQFTLTASGQPVRTLCSLCLQHKGESMIQLMKTKMQEIVAK